MRLHRMMKARVRECSRMGEYVMIDLFSYERNRVKTIAGVCSGRRVIVTLETWFESLSKGRTSKKPLTRNTQS